MIRFILRTYATPLNLFMAALVVLFIGAGVGMFLTGFW